MSPLSPSRRNVVTAVAMLVSVFMAGILTGAAILELTEDEPTIDRFAPPAPRGPFQGRLGERGAPGPGGIHITARLARRLELTPEQEERVRGILEERRARADAILQELRPRLEAQLDSTMDAVRAVLTPEQRERFDRFREEGRRAFERFQNLRGQPSPPRR